MKKILNGNSFWAVQFHCIQLYAKLFSSCLVLGDKFFQDYFQAKLLY